MNLIVVVVLVLVVVGINALAGWLSASFGLPLWAAYLIAIVTVAAGWSLLASISRVIEAKTRREANRDDSRSVEDRM